MCCLVLCVCAILSTMPSVLALSLTWLYLHSPLCDYACTVPFCTHTAFCVIVLMLPLHLIICTLTSINVQIDPGKCATHRSTGAVVDREVIGMCWDMQVEGESARMHWRASIVGESESANMHGQSTMADEETDQCNERDNDNVCTWDTPRATSTTCKPTCTTHMRECAPKHQAQGGEKMAISVWELDCTKNLQHTHFIGCTSNTRVCIKHKGAHQTQGCTSNTRCHSVHQTRGHALFGVVSPGVWTSN